MNYFINNFAVFSVFVLNLEFQKKKLWNLLKLMTVYGFDASAFAYNI